MLYVDLVFYITENVGVIKYAIKCKLDLYSHINLSISLLNNIFPYIRSLYYDLRLRCYDVARCSSLLRDNEQIGLQHRKSTISIVSCIFRGKEVRDYLQRKK